MKEGVANKKRSRQLVLVSGVHSEREHTRELANKVARKLNTQGVPCAHLPIGKLECEIRHADEPGKDTRGKAAFHFVKKMIADDARTHKNLLVVELHTYDVTGEGFGDHAHVPNYGEFLKTRIRPVADKHPCDLHCYAVLVSPDQTQEFVVNEFKRFPLREIIEESGHLKDALESAVIRIEAPAVWRVPEGETRGRQDDQATQAFYKKKGFSTELIADRLTLVLKTLFDRGCEGDVGPL